MRNIKFRVWDNKQKTFLKDISNFWIRPDFHSCFMEWRPDVDGELIFEHDKHNFVYQQYTGILDKNENPIYEGDILKWWRLSNFDNKTQGLVLQEKPVIVEFRYGGFGFTTKRNWQTLICPCGEEKVEVIGNIFENPELCQA